MRRIYCIELDCFVSSFLSCRNSHAFSDLLNLSVTHTHLLCQLYALGCCEKQIMSKDCFICGRWDLNMEHLNDGLYSGPLVVYDEFGKVLVISSFNQFMAASYEHDVLSKTVSWGIMGKVDEVPPGFTYSTIVVYGSEGFNKVNV
jgi:hypothetical protein